MSCTPLSNPPYCANARYEINAGYVEWHEIAERRIENGWTQECCPDCKRYTRWFKPSELQNRTSE